MSFLNSLLRRLFDAALYPFRELPPLVGLALVSLVIGVGMLLVFKATSNQERRWTLAEEHRAPPHVQRPCWFRYDALARVEAGQTRLVGEDLSAVDALERRLAVGLERALEPRLTVLEALPVEAPELHAARIRRALELIRRGDLYQVNLARRFEYRLQGEPVELLRALGWRTRAPFAAALEFDGVDVVSTSPELFLELRPDGVLRTEPIKGTRPRSLDATEDRRLAEELEADAKERAELTMILDVERNDLGRIARTGSVQLLESPRVRSHPTIHHRQALLGAQLRRGLGRGELLEAMLPSGSVTGAPKVRAMEVIATLEPQRRGLYTGAFGVVNRAGGLVLAIAIRTLTARGGLAHYYSGGGIVADSDPDREVEETLWKARQLTELVQASMAHPP